jgi:hypothetical protein
LSHEPLGILEALPLSKDSSAGLSIILLTKSTQQT